MSAEARKQSKDNKKELGRFSLVGLGATLIDYSILNILANLIGFPLVVANIFSATISSFFSYTLNKKVVFKDKMHSERRTLLLYIGTIIVSIFVIQTTVLYFLDKGLIRDIIARTGLEGHVLEIVASNISKAIAGFCTLAWNFMTQRRFVFESNDPSKN